MNENTSGHSGMSNFQTGLLQAFSRGLSVDAEGLAQLAGDGDGSVFGRIAANPATPEDVLCALVDDESEYVQRALAERA